MEAVKPLYKPTPEEIAACVGDWFFCDGGLIGPNPSPLGGTWAWVRVKDGQEVSRASGIIRPDKIGLSEITNNISELYAMVNGLAALPDDWFGFIVSDSLVTLRRRVKAPEKMVGTPLPLANYARKQFRRMAHCWFVHVDGHPTPKQIEAGAGKRGNLVSIWNKACDDACNVLSDADKANRVPKTPIPEIVYACQRCKDTGKYLIQINDGFGVMPATYQEYICKDCTGE